MTEVDRLRQWAQSAPIRVDHRARNVTLKSASAYSRWKRNVRAASKKVVRLEGARCEECGAADNLTRHHFWERAAPAKRHLYASVTILCRTCHNDWEVNHMSNERRRTPSRIMADADLAWVGEKPHD